MTRFKFFAAVLGAVGLAMMLGCQSTPNTARAQKTTDIAPSAKRSAHWDDHPGPWANQREYLYVADADSRVLGIVIYDPIYTQWEANAPNYYDAIGHYATAETAKRAIEQWREKHWEAK